MTIDVSSSTTCCDASELDHMWRKKANGRVMEKSIYELLGRHPRILPYHGYDPITDELVLQRLPKGDLITYLCQYPVPFKTRLSWAIEIAQGIAHLHSHDVVWNDVHLANVLVTDKFGVVLCDFGGSWLKPDRYQHPNTLPPVPYVCPTGYYGLTSRRQDIFGFGVMLFVLLAKRFPHCPTHGFVPPRQELVEASNRHYNLNFDSLSSAAYPHFTSIVSKCFNILYESGAELLVDLENAWEFWNLEFEGNGRDPDMLPPDQRTASETIDVPGRPAASSSDLESTMAGLMMDPEFKRMFEVVQETSVRMRQQFNHNHTFVSTE